MATENHKQKEHRLNGQFSDSFTEEQAVERFIYLTNKDRGRPTTIANIRRHYKNYALATLLRKHDPTAFFCED